MQVMVNRLYRVPAAVIDQYLVPPAAPSSVTGRRRLASAGGAAPGAAAKHAPQQAWRQAELAQSFPARLAARSLAHVRSYAVEVGVVQQVRLPQLPSALLLRHVGCAAK